MALFDWRLAFVEKRSLTEMVGKTFAAFADFPGIDAFIKRGKSTFLYLGLKRASATERIGMVTYPSFWNFLTHVSVALIIVHWSNRSVNRNFVKVGTA